MFAREFGTPKVLLAGSGAQVTPSPPLHSTRKSAQASKFSLKKKRHVFIMIASENSKFGGWAMSESESCGSIHVLGNNIDEWVIFEAGSDMWRYHSYSNGKLLINIQKKRKKGDDDIYGDLFDAVTNFDSCKTGKDVLSTIYGQFYNFDNQLEVFTRGLGLESIIPETLRLALNSLADLSQLKIIELSKWGSGGTGDDSYRFDKTYYIDPTLDEFSGTAQVKITNFEMLPPEENELIATFISDSNSRYGANETSDDAPNSHTWTLQSQKGFNEFKNELNGLCKKLKCAEIIAEIFIHGSQSAEDWSWKLWSISSICGYGAKYYFYNGKRSSETSYIDNLDGADDYVRDVFQGGPLKFGTKGRRIKKVTLAPGDALEMKINVDARNGEYSNSKLCDPSIFTVKLYTPEGKQQGEIDANQDALKAIAIALENSVAFVHSVEPLEIIVDVMLDKECIQRKTALFRFAKNAKAVSPITFKNQESYLKKYPTRKEVFNALAQGQ
jgi:hypothetical protein